MLKKLFSVYRKHYRRVLFGLLVVALFFLHDVSNEQIFPSIEPRFGIPLLTKLEALVYDTRLQLTMPNTVHSGVVILDIDDKSLQEREQGGEGHWPWPRDRIGALLDKLFDHYQIEVLGFDIVFAERDAASGKNILERLAQKELSAVPQFQSLYRQMRDEFDNDGIFARKLRGRKVVMGLLFSNDDPPIIKGALPAPVNFGSALGRRKLGVLNNKAYTANLPELQKNAASGGHFNSVADGDGVIRRVAMFQEHDGAYYEALSLAMLRLYLGSPPITLDMVDEPSSNYAAVDNLLVGGLKIPVGYRVTSLIPYRGGQHSFRYISVVDVLNERVDVAELKGKIVLVGTTAPGLKDLRVAPFDGSYPGVEIHANLIAGALDGTMKQMPEYALGVQLLVILLAGVALVLALPLLSVLGSTVLALAVLTAVAGANLALYHYGNFVLPLASSVMMILLLYGADTIWGYFTEARTKKQIEGLFGQYVPPELVNEMAESPASYNMAPRAAELSVLFSDVRGFTSISEALSPEDLSTYINEYLTTMSTVIREGHRGTLDKYIGDAIMAFWGAPVADTNHAQNAVLAAINMQKQSKSVNEKFAQKGWPPFKIGVGVNSGVMRVGDMGSQIRRAYTVMGDAVNLGSRLEGITKQYGADILLGESTKARISGILCREIDRVRVKGKDEPIAIFQPLGLEGEVTQSTRDQIDIWAEALRMYRAQDWDGAEAQLRRLKALQGDDELYDIFLERVADYRAHPPGADWDGVYKFETK
jgi:adenylate cyclase